MEVDLIEFVRKLTKDNAMVERKDKESLLVRLITND